MTTVFNARPYGRFDGIKNKLRRKKFRRINLGSNVLGSSFSKSDNVGAPIFHSQISSTTSWVCPAVKLTSRILLIVFHRPLRWHFPSKTNLRPLLLRNNLSSKTWPGISQDFNLCRRPALLTLYQALVISNFIVW